MAKYNPFSALTRQQTAAVLFLWLIILVISFSISFIESILHFLSQYDNPDIFGIVEFDTIIESEPILVLLLIAVVVVVSNLWMLHSRRRYFFLGSSIIVSQIGIWASNIIFSFKNGPALTSLVTTDANIAPLDEGTEVVFKLLAPPTIVQIALILVAVFLFYLDYKNSVNAESEKISQNQSTPQQDKHSKWYLN